MDDKLTSAWMGATAASLMWIAICLGKIAFG
jgi:hypothetical protein